MAQTSLSHPTILSSTTVVPSHPTPHRTLSLSESDQLMLEGYSFAIYVYKKPSHANPSLLTLDSLTNSLSQILVPYYPVAGRLRWTAVGSFEIDCCAAGVRIIEAESPAGLDNKDYGDFSPSAATRQLVPKPDHTAPLEDLPLLLMQVTKFACGGIVIGLAISHFLVDGVSAITFINSWASIARGEKNKDTIIPIPYHERDFFNSYEKKNPSFDHKEYKLERPLVIGHSNVEEERNKPTSTALLKLTKHQIEKLKERANNNNEGNISQPKERPFSRFEVVGGHIWTCLCKARDANDEQPTVMLITAGIRHRLTPQPPEGFSGNATLLTITPICKFGELIKNPLSYAAGKIREGTCRLTDEYIKSAMGFLASKDKEWTKMMYESETTPFWGNPNLDLGCWTSMPLYDADFGWGRPWYTGPLPLVVDDGWSIIMSGPDQDESLVVAICLQIKHMDEFKELFYEHM